MRINIKKIALIIIFLITGITSIAEQKKQYKPIGNIIFNALYIPACGESIKETIDFDKF